MTTTMGARAAIVEAVALASGITSSAVVWGQAGQPVADPLVRLFVRRVTDVVPSREVFVDEARSLSVMREWDVDVRIETISAGVSGDAVDRAGSLMLGLDLLAVREVLAAAELILVAAKSIGDVSFRSGDRLVYAVLFELRFRGVFDRADPTPLGWIEHVGLDGDLENPTTTVVDMIPEIEE
ncbi:MAG: hypothetical protein WC683_06265 [bacterium]